MGSAAVTIRDATRADRRAVRDVLGAAFQVEPVYAWLFPDPAQRRRRLGPLIGTMVEHMHRDLAVVQVAEGGGTVLFHLGADPGRQGQGIGTALMDAMPPVHDGAPAYLECKPAHVGYYERFGFAVSGEVVVDPTLTVVTMLRGPGADPTAT